MTLKSMTAFGWAEVHSLFGSLSAEVQSLNRKYLDISIYLPKELSAFETEVRTWVTSKVHRGKITIKVSAQFHTETPLEVSPNLPLVKQIKEAAEKISDELGMKQSVSLDINALIQLPEVLQYRTRLEHESRWLPLLKQAVEEALIKADSMKMHEGRAIFEEFNHRKEVLSVRVKEIEKLIPFVKEKYKEKIKQVLGSFSILEDQEEKLLREVCLYAERIDIAEEVSRFQVHLEQFAEKLKGKEGTQGKTLEFILQELGREVNTIGSKAQDAQISRVVVEIKNELERIREQVQNVE